MLSPIVIAGLRACLGDGESLHAVLKAERRERPEPERVVMWRCPICDELHEDEDDAAECCAEVDDGVETHPEEAACVCPVCGADHASPRSAADCCLWHDLAAYQRAEVARRVEEGATWLTAIEAVIGQIPTPLQHLRNEQPTGYVGPFGQTRPGIDPATNEPWR